MNYKEALDVLKCFEMENGGCDNLNCERQSPECAYERAEAFKLAYECLEKSAKVVQEKESKEMNSWAIKNIKTNEYVTGTDYRRFPHMQFTSNEKGLLYSDENDALFDMDCRRCGKFYKAVKVKIEEVKE